MWFLSRILCCTCSQDEAIAFCTGVLTKNKVTGRLRVGKEVNHNSFHSLSHCDSEEIEIDCVYLLCFDFDNCRDLIRL